MSCIVVMVIKCSKCPGLLLRSQGEKKKHKNYHKDLSEEQEVVKGAGDCDGKQIGDQEHEGDGQEHEGDGQDGGVGGQEAGSGGLETGWVGQDVLGEAVGGGQEDWDGGGLDNQVIG